MATQYTEDQLNKVYEKLPEELQDAIFSVETADAIRSVCEAYGVEGEQLSKTAEHAGSVLMGFLLPQDFPGVLEKAVGLPEALAQLVARDINRLVFYPVKSSLEQIHKMEIEVSAKVVTPEPLIEPEGSSKPERPAEPEVSETPQEETKGEDTYREPIE